MMFILEYKDTGWQYWLVTACLLTAGLAGNPEYFTFVIGLTVFQLIHFIFREKSITAFPVQVRFWYLMLLLIALPTQMQWLYWIPTIGTWAQVIFGYCTMARCVSLLPWNRSERLSIDHVKNVFFTRPVRGNILQGFSASVHK